MIDELPAGRRFLVRAYRKVGRIGLRLLAGPAAADHPSLEFTAGPTADDAHTGPDLDDPPWLPISWPADGVVCNICRWQGREFEGREHCEQAHCPRCGSNARDRFMFRCLTEQVRLDPSLRIIECSPRLGSAYRSAMGTWFFYRTTDYDLRSHLGNLRLDLQSVDLPDDCLDVVMCAHVLEHVPDTEKVLTELRRVIAPGGTLLLQVPVLQSRTAPPSEPEFHGDDTPVYWRFGFDLTAMLRDHGFTTELLCTRAFADAVDSGTNPWPEWSGEFDVPDMLAGAIADDLTVVADDTTAARLGTTPGYMFLTWSCRVD